MEVVYDPGHGITPAQSYITPQLLSDSHPLLPEYYSRIRQGLRLSVEGLRRSGSAEAQESEAALSQLDALEGQINDYGS